MNKIAQGIASLTLALFATSCSYQPRAKDYQPAGISQESSTQDSTKQVSFLYKEAARRLRRDETLEAVAALKDTLRIINRRPVPEEFEKKVRTLYAIALHDALLFYENLPHKDDETDPFYFINDYCKESLENMFGYWKTSGRPPIEFRFVIESTAKICDNLQRR